MVDEIDFIALLPDELFLLILFKLVVEDLCDAVLVSREWRRVVSDQSLWLPFIRDMLLIEPRFNTQPVKKLYALLVHLQFGGNNLKENATQIIRCIQRDDGEGGLVVATALRLKIQAHAGLREYESKRAQDAVVSCAKFDLCFTQMTGDVFTEFGDFYAENGVKLDARGLRLLKEKVWLVTEEVVRQCLLFGVDVDERLMNIGFGMFLECAQHNSTIGKSLITEFVSSLDSVMQLIAKRMVELLLDLFCKSEDKALNSIKAAINFAAKTENKLLRAFAKEMITRLVLLEKDSLNTTVIELIFILAGCQYIIGSEHEEKPARDFAREMIVHLIDSDRAVALAIMVKCMQATAMQSQSVAKEVIGQSADEERWLFVVDAMRSCRVVSGAMILRDCVEIESVDGGGAANVKSILLALICSGEEYLQNVARMTITKIVESYRKDCMRKLARGIVWKCIELKSDVAKEIVLAILVDGEAGLDGVDSFTEDSEFSLVSCESKESFLKEAMLDHYLVSDQCVQKVFERVMRGMAHKNYSSREQLYYILLFYAKLGLDNDWASEVVEKFIVEFAKDDDPELQKLAVRIIGECVLSVPIKNDCMYHIAKDSMQALIDGSDVLNGLAVRVVVYCANFSYSMPRAQAVCYFVVSLLEGCVDSKKPSSWSFVNKAIQEIAQSCHAKPGLVSEEIETTIVSCCARSKRPEVLAIAEDWLRQYGIGQCSSFEHYSEIAEDVFIELIVNDVMSDDVTSQALASTVIARCVKSGNRSKQAVAKVFVHCAKLASGQSLSIMHDLFEQFIGKHDKDYESVVVLALGPCALQQGNNARGEVRDIVESELDQLINSGDARLCEMALAAIVNCAELQSNAAVFAVDKVAKIFIFWGERQRSFAVDAISRCASHLDFKVVSVAVKMIRCCAELENERMVGVTKHLVDEFIGGGNGRLRYVAISAIIECVNPDVCEKGVAVKLGVFAKGIVDYYARSGKKEDAKIVTMIISKCAECSPLAIYKFLLIVLGERYICDIEKEDSGPLLAIRGSFDGSDQNRAIELSVYIVMRQAETAAFRPRFVTGSRQGKISAATKLLLAIVSGDDLDSVLQDKNTSSGRLGKIAARC